MAKSDQAELAIVVSRAFALWDKFNHQRALDILRTEKKRFPDYVKCLAQLIGEGKVTHYEKVWDLIHNAERRSEQGHYDDGVLRLYRAMEMLAQIRLREEYALDTSDINLSKLPPEARQPFAWQKEKRRERITAGFYDSYHLLVNLNDAIGPLYSTWERKIKGILERRNRSILAHGENPVGKEMWETAHEVTTGFIDQAATTLRIEADWPQFPTWEEVMAKS